MPHPAIYLIAGCNGAGKTTFANEFLPHEVKCLRFYHADEIARGLSPLNDRIMKKNRGANGAKKPPAFVSRAERAFARVVRKVRAENQKLGLRAVVVAIETGYPR